MQRAVLDPKCTDDHQQIPFEKLWGLFAGLCILWVVMIGFLLWHHVRCWGTEMRHSLAFRKLTACTGIRTQRGELCMEVWMVSIEDTNGKWLIYRREWKSWSGNRSLKREKPNQRIQEFLKCKTVLHFSHHISETMYFRITGAHTHSNTLNPNHFCYWDLVSDDIIFVCRCKNKYNMCFAFLAVSHF